MTGQQTQHKDHIMVVGGGVIGIASAHYLRQAGYQVTVIDQGDIGAACSYGNCGYVCPSHHLPLAGPGMVKTGLKSLLDPQAAFRIKPQWRWALYHWLWQFARRCNQQQMMADAVHLQAILLDSRQAFDALFAAQDLGGQWQTKGLLYVLKTAHGVVEFEKTDRLLAEHFDLKADFIDGSDLPELDAALKYGLAGGFLYKNDASLHPSQFVDSWVAALAVQGVDFISQCQLKTVNKKQGAISSIETTQGQMKADGFVFATGAWSSQLATHLQCNIPVEPCKGYSVTIDRPVQSPDLPMLFPEHRVGVTPFAESLRLGSMMEFSGFDDRIASHRIEQLYRSAEPYLHTPLSTHNERPWCGWRPMTWDSLPIIGAVPGHSNAWLATGHNMLGLTLAPATGKLLADLIAGQTPAIDPAPYAPDRF